MRNHHYIVPFFYYHSPPPRQFLRVKILLKKSASGNNFIEYKFQSRGPGHPGRTCTSTTGYFHDKTKISKNFLRVDYYLPLNYCRRQCALLSSTGAKSLANFNPKMQDFTHDLDLNCKK